MNVASIAIYESDIESPLVTIAIPTYKRGDMLSEAVNSALNQVDFEKKYDVIVVDNNPERGDSTEKVMEQYRDNASVSYYKNEENIGPIGNWRRLYELAKGDYVIMLHDDDMLFPYYLQLSFSLLENENYKYKLLYPQYYISRNRQIPEKSIPHSLKYREMSPEDYLVTQWGLPSGLMIEKDKYNRIGGYTEDFYPINDQFFIYRALHIVKGAEIRFPLCFYYIGANTSMRPDVIIESIIQADRFSKVISEDKGNKWRFFMPICRRRQISNQCKWGANFVSYDILEKAKERIGLESNWIKDMTSNILSKFLLLYIHIFKIHKFIIKQGVR